MGADGGTIPTRGELVRLKKKPEKKDKDAERQVKWQCCALSQEKLCQPVVACQLGRMYNKESILELLIDRTKFDGAGATIDHIRSLKDVRELQMTPNPAYREAAENGDGYVDRTVAPYCCPVAGNIMNGISNRFSFIWSCGCVMSEKALKEIPSPTCHKCGAEYSGADVVPINPEEAEVPGLIEHMLARKHLLREAKKAKKAAKHKPTESTSNGAAVEGASTNKKVRIEEKSDKARDATKGRTGGDMTHGVVLEKSKYRSVQHDPAASKTYKDLFTTSDQAKKQPKNNWVTFNPQYFR